MIIDCFTYFNEDAIVKLRFAELYDVVDRFVVVEANRTFTGKDKQFNFPLLEGLDKWKDKISYFQYFFSHDEDMTPWEREKEQRNALWCFCQAEKNEDDILIFSDADEILSSEFVKELPLTMGDPIQADVVQYFWNFNWRVPDHCNQGARPVVVRRGDVTSPQKMREQQLPRIPNVGWHFSFLDSSTKTKIEAFAHTEMDHDQYKDAEQVKERIRLGIDPFDRFPLKFEEIGDHHPRAVREHPEEWQGYIMNAIGEL